MREEARDSCGTREREMRLIGDVRDEFGTRARAERFARADERRQVRGRTAGHEQSAGVGGQTQPLLEPAENLELELARPGRLHPRTGVDVARARDQIAERSRPRGRSRNEGKEARVLDAAAEREDVALECG